MVATPIAICYRNRYNQLLDLGTDTARAPIQPKKPGYFTRCWQSFDAFKCKGTASVLSDVSVFFRALIASAAPPTLTVLPHHCAAAVGMMVHLMEQFFLW